MRDETPEGARTTGGHGVRRIALLVGSLLLFTVILWYGGVDSWKTVLAGDMRLYFVVFLLTGFAPGGSAWRLRTLVKAATGTDVGSLRRFFHINMTAVALGLFLPRNAAMLGGKATYLRTMGVPLLRGSWAVLMENVVDLVFLSVLLAPCALAILGDVGPAGFLAANAACVAVLLTITLGTRGRDWRGFLSGLVTRVPIIARRLPTPQEGFVPGPVRAVPMLLITLLIHAALAARAYAIALAIGLDGSWLVFAAAYPVTQLGLALAVAPGALGTLDASWLGLLILLGFPNQEAVSFTVALRACIVVFPIFWYGISALLAFTIPAGEACQAPEDVTASEGAREST